MYWPICKTPHSFSFWQKSCIPWYIKTVSIPAYCMSLAIPWIPTFQRKAFLLKGETVGHLIGTFSRIDNHSNHIDYHKLWEARKSSGMNQKAVFNQPRYPKSSDTIQVQCVHIYLRYDQRLKDRKFALFFHPIVSSIIDI